MSGIFIFLSSQCKQRLVIDSLLVFVSLLVVTLVIFYSGAFLFTIFTKPNAKFVPNK